MEPDQNTILLRECVGNGLNYLIQLSNIPEDELFKICFEFWNWFSNDVLVKKQGQNQGYVQQAP